jgi:peptide/nickel transport system substrate-binding protein
VLALLVAATALAVPAVGQQQAPVVIIQTTEPTTLDPFFQNTSTETNITIQLFNTLLARDANYKLVPALATSYKQVDKLTWEFKLRPGVKTHDGRTLTAEDVVYSFQRAVDPKVKARGIIPFALSSMDFDRAEAVDASTIRVISKKPSPWVPDYMPDVSIVPKAAYESMSVEDAARKAVGTGPYKLVEWQKGSRLVMVANDQYWGKVPAIRQVVYRAVPEAAARIAELNTGGASIITDVPPDLASQIDTRQARLVTQPSTRRIYIGFNFAGNKAIQDVRVRQALNYAIDFDKINKSLLGGRGRRVGTFSNAFWANPAVKPYPYDPAKAKQLLAQAGASQLKLKMLTPNGRYLKDVELAQAAAADMGAVGVTVDVVPIDWSLLSQQLSQAKVDGDLYFLGAGQGSTCPDDLSDFYSKSGWDPGHWLNPQFDTLIEQMGQTFDPKETQTLCNKAQEIMRDDPPQDLDRADGSDLRPEGDPDAVQQSAGDHARRSAASLPVHTGGLLRCEQRA